MLDGAPRLIGFRPDDTLVTLHESKEGESKLRFWPKPATVEPATTNPLASLQQIGKINFGQHSPDGSLTAFLIPKPGQDIRFPVVATEPFIVQKLIVVDRSGKKVLEVHSSEQESLYGERNVGLPPQHLCFSADGKRIVYQVKKAGQEQPVYDVVIHDLTTSRQTRIPISPGMKPLPFVWSPDVFRLLILAGE